MAPAMSCLAFTSSELLVPLGKFAADYQGGLRSLSGKVPRHSQRPLRSGVGRNVMPNRPVVCKWKPQDFYFLEAKKQGYVARSAFKLLEIQEKFKVITSKGRVLDLGCAPGAWLQVSCRTIGPAGGLVIGIDLTKIVVPEKYCDERVQAFVGDVFDTSAETFSTMSPKNFTTVLSDMAPSTSGISGRDADLSLDLGKKALELAVGAFEGSPSVSTGRGLLVKGGNFVVKLLEGGETRELGKQCKPLFKSVSWLRPKATRSISKEVYLIARGRL